MTASVKYALKGLFSLLILSMHMKGKSATLRVGHYHLEAYALTFLQALIYRLVNKHVGQGSVHSQVGRFFSV